MADMNSSQASGFEQADVIGNIGALWVFPIKSCAGIAVQEARLLDTGLEWDRAWMVVDAQGQFITQRSAPHMALIQPVIDTAQGVLHIRYPQLPALSVPLDLPLLPSYAQRMVKVWKSDVPAWDMGDEAAVWFTQAIGRPCRLVRYDPAHPRFSNTKWTGGIQAPNQFADGYPLLVTTSAAFAELNTRLAGQGCAGVDGLRFRANIVIDGLQAHEEDFVETFWVQAAHPVALRLGKPCSRCPIPNIDPATSIASPEVGNTIAQYRQDERLDGAISFGMNAVIAQGDGQILQVGQPVGGQLLFI